MKGFSIGSALIAVLAAAGLAATSLAATNGDAHRIACPKANGDEDAGEIDEAKLFFEFNYTDMDTGVHGFFDTGGWSELCVYGPDGKQILAVKPQRELRDLAMAGIFFESREPEEAELSQAEILTMFPAGTYTVKGTSHEGERLAGEAVLTHDIPAPPTILSPEDGDVVGIEDLVIEWEPVTETVSGGALEITGYEVIVTKETEEEDPNGFSQPILSAHVLPSVTSFTVPSEFLEEGTEYELEVLALEVSGNQTISLLFFETD